MKRLMKLIFLLVPLLTLFGMEKSQATDDLDVYTGAVSTAPNILIIFDNSTSMAEKVPYDDTVDYSVYIPATLTDCNQAYARETIYYRDVCCGGNSSGVGETCDENTGCRPIGISCRSYKYLPRANTMRAFVDTNKDGQDDTNCQWNSNGECYIENSVRQLYKGNYLNWLKYYNQNKYQAGKAAVLDLVGQFQDKINFGLMVFRNDDTSCNSYIQKASGVYPKSDGGELLEPFGPNKLTAFTNWLNDQRAMPGGRWPIRLPSYCATPQPNKHVMFTPLAEALSHAGMYFEGGWNGNGYGANLNQCSDYNDILIFGVPNCWNKLPFKVPVYNTDANHSLGMGPAPLDSNDIKVKCQTNHIILMTDGNPAHDGNPRIIKKYVPGLAWNNPDDRDEENNWPFAQHYLDEVAAALYNLDFCPPHKRNVTTHVIGFGLENQLLKNTATNGHGKFIKAGNAQALKDAFQEIVASITTENVIISATPTVPVHGMTSGDYIYIPFASTNFNEGGDVQKYKLVNGAVKGCDGTAVTNTTTGLFIDNYQGHACWSVNDKLGDLSTRSIYTYFCKEDNGIDDKVDINGKADINLCGEKNIKISANLFDKTNTNIKAKTLGYCVNNANADTDPTCISKKETLIAYVHGYGATNTSQKRTEILGGVLHSSPLVVSYSNKTVVYFGANDGMLHAVDDSTGSEMWAFIPPNLLPTLKLMVTSPDSKNYYVDSSPKLVELNGKDTVYNPNDNQNQAENRLAKRILIFGQRMGGSNYYALNVTDYSQPKFLWEISSTSHSGLYGYLAQTWSEPVFGNLNVGTGDQKAARAVAFFGNGFSDTKQGAVYAADVLTGQRRWAKTDPNMKSIPSQVLAYDEEDDGYIERVYVGDLGGQLWAFNLKNTPGLAEAARRLFTANCGGPSCKIFYPPDLVKEQGAHYLYFGTGDRNDPMGKTRTDRFYCVKDRNSFKTTNLTEATLADVNKVENDLATLTDANERTKKINSLKQADGWYIIFNAPGGEKVLAAPTVFLGMVFFATFDPTAPADTDNDPCTSPVGGTVRLYALNYLTGLAFFPWDKTNTKKDSNNNPTLGRADRAQKLSLTGIPSEVIITIQPPQLQQGAAPPSGKAGGTVTPTVAGGAGIAAPGGISITNNLLDYSWRVLNP